MLMALAGCLGVLSPAAAQSASGPGAYKLGAPYQAGGLWYVPAEQPAYDEVGVAGWYGDGLDGQATANGERFDGAAATAAHPTLPMPCIVEVTNLDNGRVLRVRLNDRGGFAAGRMIDLSRGAAERLGFLQQGQAKVRVRYLGPAALDRGLGDVALAEVPPPTQAGLESFAVQAGAFSQRTNAERVIRRLARAGAATIEPLDRNGARLYRVVLGPWTTQAAATAARTQAAALGFVDARVIRAS